MPGRDNNMDDVKISDQFKSKASNLDEKSVAYRAAEGIPYVKFPVDARYQTVNIYAPEAFFVGGSVNGYTAKTAPIFLPNSIGGYMPGEAARPGSGMDRMHNTILSAIAHGYVVAAPGARGRTLKDGSGTYTGKAPAAIVDLKAAVRFLKAHRGEFPGNVDRIVANGTSAGGAMATLLGATGNSPDYAPYLAALGAANATDDVWAVSAYCPITNLDHADAAYEWLLADVHETKAFGMGRPPGGRPAFGPGGPPDRNGPNPFGQPNSGAATLSADQIAYANLLRASFPNYVNGLALKSPTGASLTLDPNGVGPFRDYVRGLVVASARDAQAKGADISKTPWVKLSPTGVVDIDWDLYVSSVGRMKAPAAFDALDLRTGENNLFGSASRDSQHFTALGQIHTTVADATSADPAVVKMMNPMPYIGSTATKTSKLWRIRHGLIDRDTSIAIPVILATKLSNAGCDVDLSLPWNTPHSGDYDLTELFAWIDRHARR